MEVLCFALPSASYGCSTNVEDTSFAFSERVAAIADGHEYRVHDIATAFLSDFGQALDRSWQQYAPEYSTCIINWLRLYRSCNINLVVWITPNSVFVELCTSGLFLNIKF